MSLLLLLRKSGANQYLLTCETGVYTVTGQNATLLKSRLLVAQVGSYSLTGNNATLLKSNRIIAQTGSYSLTGNSAVLTWVGSANAYTLTCLTGSYNLVGQAAILKRSRLITAQTGIYTFVGQAAVLRKSKVLISQTGAYVFAGNNANLIWTGSVGQTNSVQWYTKQKNHQKTLINMQKYLNPMPVQNNYLTERPVRSFYFY